MNSPNNLQLFKRPMFPLLLRSLFVVFMMIFIPVAAFCQPKTDQELIIKKCLDISAIQSYFPKNTNSTFKKVYVLQYPVFFKGKPNITKFDQPVSFLERPELNGEHPDAYINFQKFSITENTAEAVFILSYDRFTSAPHLETLNVSLQKNEGNWTIINTTTNKL